VDYHIYPPLLFCFILVFITICCTDFYSSVLCSSLLPTSSLSLVPALYSTIESSVSQLCKWYFYHTTALGYDFTPSYCFVLDYPFINQTLSLLPSTLLMSVFSCTEFVATVDPEMEMKTLHIFYTAVSHYTDHHSEIQQVCRPVQNKQEFPFFPFTCKYMVTWYWR